MAVAAILTGSSSIICSKGRWLPPPESPLCLPAACSKRDKEGRRPGLETGLQAASGRERGSEVIERRG
eukprot:55385-Eustigmatos_ZCMA.PRE.1